MVFDISPTSSPGPDGFTGHFYRESWDIIKDDLQKATVEFFNGFHIPRSLGATSLILLRKNPSLASLDNFCPISLCNVIHKILSKLLLNRLKPHLHSIISPEQVGFIEGRDIQSNISLARELVQSINKKKYGGNLMIKIDMSKAYDRLSRGFIIRALRWYGFSHKFCNLVYYSISNCWYYVMWGGKSFGFFKSNRGVRQGDPISSSLFILAMNVFTCSSTKKSPRGEWILSDRPPLLTMFIISSMQMTCSFSPMGGRNCSGGFCTFSISSA